MQTTFGGLTKNEYIKYSSIDSESKIGYAWKFTKRITRSAITEEYLNNGYLLSKFASHSFDSIEQEGELNDAKEIIQRFEKCSDLKDSALLGKVRQAIATAEERIHQLNNNNNSDGADESDSNDSQDNLNNLNNLNNDVYPEVEDSGLTGSNSNVINIINEYSDKEKEEEKDNITQVVLTDSAKINKQIITIVPDYSSSSTSASDEDKSPIFSRSTSPNIDFNYLDDFESTKNEFNLNSAVFENISDEVKNEEVEETESNVNIFTSYVFNPVVPPSTSDAQSKENKIELSKTLKALDLFFNEPFPELIDNIDEKSLNINSMLIQDKRAWTAYRNRLKIALNAFHTISTAIKEKKLKSYDRMDELVTFIRKANVCFIKSCLDPFKEVAKLHEQFKDTDAYRTNPPNLANGVVFCSKEQYLAVAKVFEEHFPGLTTNFDVPELGIYQSYQIMILFRSILIGPERASEESIQDDDIQNEADLKNLICIRQEDFQPQQKVEQGWGSYLLSGMRNALLTVGTAASEATVSVFNGIVWAAKYPFSESENPEDIKWKIIRFEALNSAVKELIKKNTISTLGLESNINEENLLKSLSERFSAEAFSLLLPMVQFSFITHKSGLERFSVEYMDELRNQYNKEFIDRLRAASNWAENTLTKSLSENNTDVKCAQFIDGLCYHYYTNLHLNECCEEVVNLLEQRGVQENAYQKTDNPVKEADNLVKGTYERIHSLDSNVRGSTVNQKANSLRGHVSGIPFVTTFDPNRQSNFPQQLYVEKVSGENNFEIKQLAMGSPTIDAGWGKPEIDPLFIGYLRYCQRHELVHVYKNYQNAIPKSRFEGDESMRCEALINLAEDRFRGTLYVLTFSEDSALSKLENPLPRGLSKEDFKKEFSRKLFKGSFDKYGYRLKPYHRFQSGRIANQEEFEKIIAMMLNKAANTYSDNQFPLSKRDSDLLFINMLTSLYTLSAFEKDNSSMVDAYASFRTELLKQVFDEKREISGNFIPEDLVNNHDLKNWSLEACDQIYNTLFYSQRNVILDFKQRRIFTRIFELLLSEKVTLLTQAHAENETCKDGIDRGISRRLIKFIYRAIIDGKVDQPGFMSYLKTLIFSRAAIVRKRAILSHRLHLGWEVGKFMLKNKEKIRRLEEIVFPEQTREMRFSSSHFSENIQINIS